MLTSDYRHLIGSFGNRTNVTYPQDEEVYNFLCEQRHFVWASMSISDKALGLCSRTSGRATETGGAPTDLRPFDGCAQDAARPSRLVNLSVVA